MLKPDEKGEPATGVKVPSSAILRTATSGEYDARKRRVPA
jgi:hypothetical protein